MKKHLLLAAAALLGFAATATTMPSGTLVSDVSTFTDGTIITMQCLDNNGGYLWYFNGATTKTPTLSYDVLYKVCVQDDDQFVLQSISTEKYVGCATTAFSGNALVAMTDDIDAAGKFAVSKVNNPVAFRFAVNSSSSYLNTNDAGATPKYWSGTAGYSYWKVMTYTADEVEQIKNYVFEADITEGTPYIVKNLYKGLYLNGQQVDVPDHNNASVSAVPSIIYFEQNPENEAQFAIRVNDKDNGKYISEEGTYNWDTSMTNSPYYWSICDQTGNATQGGQVVRFARNNADNNNLICNGNQKTNGTSVYDNQGASENGTAWEIIPLSSVNIRNIANTTYQALTGTTPQAALDQIAYVPASNEQMSALATVLNNTSSTDEEIIAALNQVTLNFYNTWSANMSAIDGGIYTIEAGKELGARGYLGVYDGVLNTSKKITTPAFNANNNAFRFVAVKDGENTYLYSLAGEKFLNAFGPDTDSSHGPFANNVDHVWQISDVPTPIEFVDYYGSESNLTCLLGGLEPSKHAYTGHPNKGGMTLVGSNNSGSWLAYVTVGITDNADGSAIKPTHVGNVTEAELAEIKAKLSANHSTLDNTIASIPSIDDGVTIVNHYPGTIITDLEDKTPDHQNFLLETATRHPLTNGYVYSIETAEGKAYRYTGTEAITAEEYESGDNAFHWQALVADDGTVSFVHHDTGEQVQRATSTITLPDVSGTPDLSTVGKVGFNGQLYTITQRGTSEADATTGIREISAGSNTPAALYDLSGRRVISPAKGIYVTAQGKKILVK